MISKVFLQLIEYLDWKTFEYGATDRRSSMMASELGTKLNADIFPITFPGQHIVLFVRRAIWGKKNVPRISYTFEREREKSRLLPRENIFRNFFAASQPCRRRLFLYHKLQSSIFRMEPTTKNGCRFDLCAHAYASKHCKHSLVDSSSIALAVSY